MCEQNVLSPPLRQAALVFVRAGDAAEIADADLRAARSKQTGAANMYRRLQEGREHAGARKKFEAGRLNSGRAGLPMRDELLFDDARHDAMAGQLASREEAGRTGADNQNLLPLRVGP